MFVDGITAHAYHNVQIERTASGDKLQDDFFLCLNPASVLTQQMPTPVFYIN